MALFSKPCCSNSRIDSILQNSIHFPTGMLWFLKWFSKTIRFCRETKNKIKQHKKNILKVLGMGGIGTNQQKHRENQKKTKKTKTNNIPEVLGMGGIGTKQKKHRENQRKKNKKKQYSRGLGDGGGVPPRVSKYCFLLFFWVSQCFFDFSPWSPPQRDSMHFFNYVIITWRFILMFFLFMVLSGGQTTWRADKLKGC